MNTFFQHVLNLTGLEFVKDKDIYEATRKRVRVDHILDWVKDVKEWSKIAHDLRNPKGNFLDHSHKSQSCEIHLDRIHKIGASAVIPLLMAGYKKYWLSGDHKSFNRLAEACLKYHLRTQTIGKASVDKYQKHIFKVTYDFYNEADPLDVRKVIAALKDGDLYPSGAKLHTLLKEGYGPNTSIATVLLELIEENQSDKLSHTSVTVEHILPKSLSGEWRRYISKCHLGCNEIEATQIHKKYHTYLGNLTLLNRGQNSKGKNNLFNIKKKLYKKTDYKITRELADIPRWGEDQIIDRHGKFVDELLQILR